MCLVGRDPLAREAVGAVPTHNRACGERFELRKAVPAENENFHAFLVVARSIS